MWSKSAFPKASCSSGVWVKPGYNFPLHINWLESSLLSCVVQIFLIDICTYALTVKNYLDKGIRMFIAALFVISEKLEITRIST